MFYQGGPTNNFTHVPGPVSQSSTEIEYNAACNSGMDMENLGTLNNDWLNKDTCVIT